MLSPRWTKTLRDLWLARGRVLMMVMAIAAGVIGVGTIMDAYAILTREISRNYLETKPASASLELDGITPALVAQVRQQPGIADAQARATATARVQTAKGGWLPLRAFVAPDFRDMRISTFFPNSGAWPPPDGTILLEREVPELLGVHEGDTLTIKDGEGKLHPVKVAGTVHDPSLAPAGQEQTAYVYMTPATLDTLGDVQRSEVLKIAVSEEPLNEQAIARTAGNLAHWLEQNGHPVHGIFIPPPGMHPHQGQMSGMLLMLMMFGGLALIVAAILTATMVNAMLAQQVRQIGVMKTLGGRSGQIARLYLCAMGVIGLAACALGIPLALMAGQTLARAGADLLNFKLASESVPADMLAIQLGAGLLLPMLFAWLPIRRAARMTVRAALDDHGVSQKAFGARGFDSLLARIGGLDRTLLLAIRNSFRRRGRLVLTLGLLATAGGLFLASLNVSEAWRENLRQSAGERHYDMEVRLNRPQSLAQVQSVLRAIPGVDQVEPWEAEAASRARPDGHPIERTYPDGGHGSLTLRAAPAGTKMIGVELLAGSWLPSADVGSIVLNPGARARFPQVQIGQQIQVAVHGRTVPLRVAGFVREILSPAQGYVTPATLAKIRSEGMEQASVLRISLTSHEPAARETAAHAAEDALVKAGIGVRQIITEGVLDTALNGHVFILIFNLVAISVLMAIVGALGLTSSMSTAVVERTREIGVMRAIGARGATLMRNIVGEAVVTGLLSWLVAMALTIPLSMALGDFIGRASFGLPLPFVMSPQAALMWLGLVLAGAVAASIVPARRAAALTVRDALAYV